MMETIYLSLEEKDRLMPYVISALSTVCNVRKFGVIGYAAEEVIRHDDKFLTLCYTLVASGNNPLTSIAIFSNFINCEDNLFIRVKMSIQSGVILTLQYKLQPQDCTAIAALTALSYLGLDYKKRFINNIRDSDAALYNMLFKEEEFRDFNISAIS